MEFGGYGCIVIAQIGKPTNVRVDNYSGSCGKTSITIFQCAIIKTDVVLKYKQKKSR
jgi:hypothetical protein